MKKFYLSIITLLLVIMMIPVVHAENKVKVYVFSKVGCTACESAFDYFNGLLEDNPDMFELVTYETFTGSWGIKNEDYYNILIATLEHFGEDTNEIGTPIIVVGDYLQIGIDNISAFEDRINDFSLIELENMLLDLMRKELNAIVYLGGLLGLLMGFVMDFF